MIALLMEIIPTCLELCVSYDWQFMASKLSLRHLMAIQAIRYLYGFSRINYVGVARNVRPHSDY